jgi:hypothetical protein
MVGVICVFLLSCSDKKPEGKTQEKAERNTEANTDRWIYFGETETGILYYDKISVTNVSPKIIKVWTREKLSKVGKDKIIRSRRFTKQPLVGWDKLDVTMFLIEVDCVNNTRKMIKMGNYDYEGNPLYEYDFPNPGIEQVLPGSMGEDLLRKVCPK